MLDKLDLGASVQDAAYKARLAQLTRRLYQLQKACWESKTPVIVLFEGWDSRSHVKTIGRLAQRLDPRGFKLYPIRGPRSYERKFPWIWRFWLKIPGRGEWAFFTPSWYGRVLYERVEGLIDNKQRQRAYQQIVDYEKTLVADGYILVKFWLHIDAEELQRRFKKNRSDPFKVWELTRVDWSHNEHYDAYRAAAEDMFDRTHTPQTPWTLVSATDKRHARLRVFETLIDQLERRRPAPPVDAPKPQPGRRASRLDGVNLKVSLSKKEYTPLLKRYQLALRLLAYRAYQKKRPVILVYEGWDAAGKGGNIKRLTAKLDPRSYAVHSIAAPQGEDASRHYLWRFWRRLPEAGQLAVFDRSWYGRVLVERVEGFCSTADWQRAYDEINRFEAELADFGAVIFKFWIHIDADEQLDRFHNREHDEFKNWKLTEEDWRNRGKWDLYQAAVEDMLQHTQTRIAPWDVIAGNDKRHARVATLKTVVKRLSAELKYDPFAGLKDTTPADRP